MQWIYLAFATGVVIFYFKEWSSGIIALAGRLWQHICTAVHNKKSAKHKILSDTIMDINGQAKTNFAKSSYDDMIKAFAQSGDSRGLVHIKMLCVICSASGMLVAYFIKSYMLIPVLGVGLALLPMWVTRLKSYAYARRLQSELSVSLSAITASYLRTGNIIKAVEENLAFIKTPVNKVFSEFLTNYKLVDKNISSNIAQMSERINHTVFKTWCQNLIICQSDKNHMPALNAILDALDSEKRMNDKLRLEIYSPLAETLTITAMMPLVFPALYFFGNDTLHILFTSLIGQMCTCGLAVSVLLAIDKSIKLCDPQLHGGD